MRTLRRIAAALLVVLLAGCGGNGPSATSSPSNDAGPAPTVVTAHIEAGGLTRDYRVVAPPNVTERGQLPLLLVLHWLGGSIDDVETATGYDALAADPGAVVVYPQGYEASWNAGGCCKPATADGIDDVGFLAALIDQMAATYPIDPDRVFIWGASTGGQMAYRAACKLSDRIAAVADISGNLVTDCSPAHPVSVIDIHGTADTDVPYDGCVDGSCPSVPDVMETWRQLDDCTGDPSIDQPADRTVETIYASCQDGTALTFVKAIDEGHNLDTVQIDVSAVTWAFLMDHPRATGPA